MYLINLGNKRLEHDHCVLSHKNGIIIAIFVDDLLLLGPYLAEISNLKKQLGDRFRMRDMGPISWYLGMEVIRDRPNRTLYINQSAFTQRMLEDLEMEDCKSAKVPMDSGIELVKDVYQGQEYRATKEQVQGYQSLVGSLLWLACMTRPDISFSVGKCSRYASNPTPTHDAALKRIVRYLKGSKRLGLKYGPGLGPESSNGNLLGYTDASYGDCLDTRRSTSAYVFLLWNGPISWSSKRQTTVATSTAEAEYVGECNAAKESVFLAGSLKGIGYEGLDVETVLLLADNQAAIKLANNPVNHPRAKHIDIQYHKVRELISDAVLELDYIETSKMVADGLTKPLTLVKHEYFITMLGLAEKSGELALKGLN